MRKLKRANKYARLACLSRSRLVREINKKLYQSMSERYDVEQFNKLAAYLAGEKSTNTYPWPYSDQEFANWPEAEVLDQSGCKVRDCTSYCAYKIRETTGIWPKKTRMRLEARDWVQFLENSGYVCQVSGYRLDNEKNYVGINPDAGESGIVVWFEHMYWEGTPEVFLEYSTYRDGEYVYESGNPNDYLWVEI